MASKRYNRGLSLIELLVVIVILVIGIFAIAQVFPQGFRTLAHARNVTLAARLNQAEEELWKASAANVPDGIVAEGATSNSSDIVTDYNPNDLHTLTPPEIDPGEDSAYYSNVNRVRQIKGETTVIPAATLLPYEPDATQPKYAYSIYNLKFAPIEFDATKTADPGDGLTFPDQYVLIYGDPLARNDVTGQDTQGVEDTVNAMNFQDYAIDYDKGVVYFKQAHWPRTFKMNYAYWEGNVLKSGQDIFTVKEGNTNFRTPLPTEPASHELMHHPLDAYSDQCAYKFIYTPADQPFDRFNPYEFTILSKYSIASFSPTIGFNPIGANRQVRTNLGNRPLRAHIDYDVQDWHIIHETRTVPSPSSPDANGYQMRLTLGNVKVANRRYGDLSSVYSTGPINQVTNVYKGLTPTLTGYSVVALDLTDNTLMVDNIGATGLQVDYANGTVTIPQNVTKYTPFGAQEANQDVRGHDVRFFYQAVGDWAVQVTKAWSNYQRLDVAPTFSNLQYNNFDVELIQPGSASLRHTNYTNDTKQVVALLTFPQSDAGKAISVSLQWTDNNNVVHQVTGRQEELNDVPLGIPSGKDAGPAAYPFIAVPFAYPSDFTKPTSTDESWKNPYFTFVQGASLKVRTIWREDPRRWESRDLETTLTRQ